MEKNETPKGILLLNCTSCDDIIRLDEGIRRPCLCGKSTASPASGRWMTSGPSRLLLIRFEEYDGAAPGLPRRWEVLA